MGKTSNRDGAWTSGTKKFADKFYIDNYSKTSGIAATTWYEVGTYTGCKVIAIYFKQDNTDNLLKAMNFKVTIDGHALELDGATANIDDNSMYELMLGSAGGSIPDVGDDPVMFASKNAGHGFGYPIYDGGGTQIGVFVFGVHSVKVEYYFGAIGTAQEFHCDVYYLKKEAI